MQRGRCARVAEKQLRRLAGLVGLDGWTIELVVGRCSSDEAVAEVVCQGEYLRADLTVDNKKLDDEEALLATLAHEVLHIALWPIELCAPIAYSACDEGPARKMLELSLVQAIERTVVGLEPLLISAYKREYE